MKHFKIHKLVQNKNCVIFNECQFVTFSHKKNWTILRNTDDHLALQKIVKLDRLLQL